MLRLSLLDSVGVFLDSAGARLQVHQCLALYIPELELSSDILT